MANLVIVELDRNHSINYATLVKEIVKIEKLLFPNHESLATVFDGEFKKKNYGLLFSHINREVTGYVMYQWPSSLLASITKLACRRIIEDKAMEKHYLKQQFINADRHIQRVQLHVDPSRTAALYLYQKMGF